MLWRSVRSSRVNSIKHGVDSETCLFFKNKERRTLLLLLFLRVMS